MRITIKHCITFLFAVSVAPVFADEGTPAPTTPLQANPIPLEVMQDAVDEESLDASITEEPPAELPSDSNIQIIEREPAPNSEAASTETADVAIVKSDEKSDEGASRPPANAVPGLNSEEDTTDTASSESASDTESPSALINPDAPIEVINERYPSGAVKIRREMTLDRDGNYVKHGQWTMYSESGEEIASGKFVANQRHGAWQKEINWGESPLLNTLPYPQFQAPFSSEATFTNGQLHGTWTIKDSQGRVASEWHYRNGKLHGDAKWFYADGKVREVINYENGLINGTWQIVDADGNDLENTPYQLGRKLATKQDTYENGVLKWEGMFLHETFVVDTVDDWWNTRPVSYKAVGEAERHGAFTSWYKSGQKKFSGTFQHEIRTGEFTWWHENTQVAVQGSFSKDERHGPWVWWHENGQKAIQGEYQNGKLMGPWFYWDADGKLERKIDYNETNQPVASHAVPATAIQSSSMEPVGTGVRTANRSTPQRRTTRRNPVRR